MRNAILSILYCAVWCLASAQAQDDVQPDPNSGPFACAKELSSSQGQEALKQTQKRYSQIKSLKGRFLQKSYLSALDQSETSSGEMSFLKPGLMKWVYLDPHRQTFVIRDTTLWLYQEDLNQVVIQEFEKVLVSDLPVAFLMGIGDLTKDFELQKACENRDGTVLELAPRNKKGDSENSLNTFSLLIEKGSFTPKGALVTDVGSNSTSIIFSQTQVNPAGLDEKDFEAKIPSGADIDDRRSKAPAVIEKNLNPE
jgi:outer membrane lipoprotein carrier protein